MSHRWESNRPSSRYDQSSQRYDQNSSQRYDQSSSQRYDQNSSQRYDQNSRNWGGTNRDRRDSQFQRHYNRSSSDNWNSDSNTQIYSNSSRKRSNDDSNDTNELVIYIDANNVGRLIGKGGSKIKALQDESNAKINVSNMNIYTYIYVKCNLTVILLPLSRLTNNQVKMDRLL